MKTMTKTEFKPVLIFTDEERTEKNLKQAENNCNQINEKLKSAIKGTIRDFRKWCKLIFRDFQKTISVPKSN